MKTAVAAPPVDPREHLRQLLWALLRQRIEAKRSNLPQHMEMRGLRSVLDAAKAGRPILLWVNGHWERVD